MPKGRLRLLSAVPGPTSRIPIVRDFAKHTEGVVTAFSDSLLPNISRQLGEDTPLELRPFGEFVRQSLEFSGEEALPIASSSYCVAAIEHVCKQLGPESPFFKSASFPGLHQALWRTLHELQAWGIFGPELAALSATSSPRLAQKLISLATIDAGMGEILQRIGRQTHAQHLAMGLDSVWEKDGGGDHVLIFAGSEFSPLRIEWIQWLVSSGSDVTVVIDRHASESHLFEGAMQIAKALGGNGIEIGGGNKLTRNLFGSEKLDGTAVDVSISSAPNPLFECEWALRRCLTFPDRSRCGIYVRNLDEYAPFLEMASRRLGVPIRMARRVPLLTNSFARLTLATLKFCASNDVRSIEPVIQSSYLALLPSDLNELRTALREAHRARSAQWTRLSEWLTTTENRYPWLVAILDWRTQALNASGNLAEWAGQLRTLVDLLPWHEALTQGKTESRARDLRAQTALQRSLADIASIDVVSGQPSHGLAGFVKRCEDLWKQADVSIPSGEDGVVITSDVGHFFDLQHLGLLGVIEGTFPRRRTEDPILTDDERQEISRLAGLRFPLRTSFDVARTERDDFYRVCCSSTESISFSYPVADEESDNIPAFYLSKIENALGNVPRTVYAVDALAPKLEDCQAPKDLELRLALDHLPVKLEKVELVSEEAIAAVRHSDSLGFTPNHLRDATQCAFKAVVQHQLSLEPKLRSSRWNRLRWLPRNATLLTQPTLEAAQVALITALEAEVDSLYSELPEWESKLLTSGGKRMIDGWIQREFEARKVWPRIEGSVKLNVPFGTAFLRDVLPGGIRLAGTVPAISESGAIRVIHLSTGSVQEPKNISDSERLFLGVHFLAMHDPGVYGAIDIEGMSKDRKLFLITNDIPKPFLSRPSLEVKTLVEGDPVVAKKEFCEKVLKTLRQTVDVIKCGTLEPKPGEPCARCKFGELCRRSSVFGDTESPFGLDHESADE